MVAPRLPGAKTKRVTRSPKPSTPPDPRPSQWAKARADGDEPVCSLDIVNRDALMDRLTNPFGAHLLAMIELIGQVNNEYELFDELLTRDENSMIFNEPGDDIPLQLENLVLQISRIHSRLILWRGFTAELYQERSKGGAA